MKVFSIILFLFISINGLENSNISKKRFSLNFKVNNINHLNTQEISMFLNLLENSKFLELYQYLIEYDIIKPNYKIESLIINNNLIYETEIRIMTLKQL